MAGAFLRSPCFVDALCNWLPAAQIDRTVVSFTSALICFIGCTVVCYAVMRRERRAWMPPPMSQNCRCILHPDLGKGDSRADR